MCGVGPLTFWIPTFLWDFINFIFPSILLLAVFAGYDEQAYIGDHRWVIVILILVIYGWSVLSVMYALQYFFMNPATGIVVVIMLNISTGKTTITLSPYLLSSV